MRTYSSTTRLRILAAAVLAPLLVTAGCGAPDPTGPKHRAGTKKPEVPADSSAPAPASVSATPRPGDQLVTLDWKGEQRQYRVHAPPGYTPAGRLPLVIALHPYPSDSAYMTVLSGLSAKADQENFLVVYPDGHHSGYNALTCCGDEDDVGLIRSITKTLVEDWKADPARVYATGISNGGDLSFKLAVELPGTLAAIAPVSGGFSGGPALEDDYAPETPVSVLTFIGSLDRHGSAFEEGVKSWQERLSCTPGATEKLPKKITKTSARCRDGSEVVTYVLAEMGHNWPGSTDATMGDSEAGVDATDLMWEFFEDHPRIPR